MDIADDVLFVPTPYICEPTGRLFPVAPLLYVSVTLNDYFIESENKRNIRNALDVFVPVVMDNVIKGDYKVPYSIEPFGVCVVVVTHRSHHTIRLVTLQQRHFAPPDAFKWRKSDEWRRADVQQLLIYGVRNKQLYLDGWTMWVETFHLKCGEAGLLKLIREFVMPMDDTVEKMVRSIVPL